MTHSKNGKLIIYNKDSNMGSCYCIQFSFNDINECVIEYTDCDGNPVSDTFYSGVSYSICSQDEEPTTSCISFAFTGVTFYINCLCENGECVGTPILPRNECDVITIFPMGVECLVNNPTQSGIFDGSASLIITGGTPPYTIIWDNGNISPAITNLGPGEYGATVIDYYGDFTANTICVLTGSTPTPSPTPTPTPTPIPTYNELCFIITRNIGMFTFDETIQFTYNGEYNGKPTWISDDTLYDIVWMSGSSRWEVSGWTTGSIVNINPGTPPIIGWQGIGTFGIQSISVAEGSCEDLGIVSYKVYKNDPTCGCNGSIIFDVVQGYPPYQYSINGGNTYQESPIFNNLCYGDYVVKVLDYSGNTNVQPITLSEPPPPTNYTLQLNLNYGLGIFDLSITPTLPNGVSVSFDLIHTKQFMVSPNVGAATYTNDVTLNVDGSPVSYDSTSENSSVVLLSNKECLGGTNTTTNTINTWNQITMISGTIVNGSFSNQINPITPLVNCYGIGGYYSIYLDNVNISGCECCNVVIVNPPEPPQ